LHMRRTTFFPEHFLKEEIAPTEIDPWRGRTIQGEVHDESTFILRKKYITTAAGLFSTTPDILTFLEMLLHRGVYEGARYFSEEMIQRSERADPAAEEPAKKRGGNQDRQRPQEPAIEGARRKRVERGGQRVRPQKDAGPRSRQQKQEEQGQEEALRNSSEPDEPQSQECIPSWRPEQGRPLDRPFAGLAVAAPTSAGAPRCACRGKFARSACSAGRSPAGARAESACRRSAPGPRGLRD